MWDQGYLGESSPTQLRETVIFLLGIYVGLRAGDEHYNLRRDTNDLPSQLSFKCNAEGVRCLVHQEDCTTKTNDGGINSMHKDRKIIWVYPSDNKICCPVRIIDKYISLLPPVKTNKKANFYLRSLERFTPAQWYGEQVVGLNSIRKVISTLAENAGLQGFFTNHSLRCTGITQLFQAGVDRKLVKEFSGHSSDAVDAYQITSDAQRKQISSVIAGESDTKSTEKQVKSTDLAIEMNVDSCSDACYCGKLESNKKEIDDISVMMKEMLRLNTGKKTKITISMEFE